MYEEIWLSFILVAKFGQKCQLLYFIFLLNAVTMMVDCKVLIFVQTLKRKRTCINSIFFRNMIEEIHTKAYA